MRIIAEQTTCHWHGACQIVFAILCLRGAAKQMTLASLTLSSKNYSSWSLRGWLMAKLSGIDFEETILAPDDADARAEILLLSPSILVPCLTHDGVKIWD